jgi:DtxR family Mn-dependent transcriptional regulator
MYSQTVEDYLKAIYTLEEKESIAKTGALARQLDITAGSVTEMVKRMAANPEPLIRYRHHQGVQLTQRGRHRALAVIRRHRLLETFLHQTLGLGWEAVHQEAETLEHHLSDRVVRALDRHLNHPRCDPHGEPIPDTQGQMHAPAGQDLTTLEPGTRFRVVRVDPSLDGMLDYLGTLKIGLGTVGTLIGQAPFDGPLTLRLDDAERQTETVMGPDVAARIYVECI